MFSKLKYLFLIFFIACGFLFANESPYELIKDKSKIQFTADPKLFFLPKAVGTFSDYSIAAKITGEKFTDLDIVVTIKTASLDTDNKKRDSHLREEDFFWTEKYPTAVYKSSHIANQGKGKYRVEGDLTLRGVKKYVPFDAKVETGVDGNPNLYKVTAELQTNRRYFGMDYNGLGGIRDEVEIKISLLVLRKGTPKAKLNP